MANKSKPATPQLRMAVERLAGHGCVREQIADITGIPVRTLTRRYGVELARGRSGAVAKLGGRMFKSAMAGNVSAGCFLLKTLGGWREVQRTEVVGDGGGPVAVANTPATVMLIPVVDAETWKSTVAEHQRQLIARYRIDRA